MLTYIVTLKGYLLGHLMGKKVEFRGERNKVYEGLLSILVARKLVRKWAKFTLFMLSHLNITATD